VSHPQLPVDRFKQTLRRDLKAAERRAGSPGWKLAFAASSASAAAFAFLLLLFVLDPSVPSRLHASVLGSSPRTLDAAGGGRLDTTDLQDVSLRYFLDRTDASAKVDREFLERWYSDRARPVSVKSVEDEKILAIRQFQLTSGERVVVLTEIGSEGQQRDIQSVTASNLDY
jgi:hypothetical protein